MSDKEKLDAIIAEIKEWKEGWTYRLNNTNPANPDFFEGGVEVCEHFLSFIETMEEETDSLVNLGNGVYYVPKFKVGDKIKPVDSCLGSPRIIKEVCDNYYVTDQGTLDFEFENNWEVVE